MITNGVKNIIFEIIYYILNIIVNFIIRKQIINYIGLEVVALNHILSQIISFITVLEFGICNVMVFNLYNVIKENNNEKINNIMNIYKRIYTYITIIITFLGICFIPFIKYFINDYSLSINYIIVYLVLLIQSASTFLFSYKTYLLQAFQKSYLYLIIMIIFKVIFSILNILSLIKLKNYYLYLSFCIIENILMYYTISKYTDKKYSFLNNKKEKVNCEDYKEIKIHVKSTAVSKICGVLSPSLDTFILGIISNVKTLGLYSNYYLLISSISWAVQKLFTSFKAIIASILNKENQYIIFKSMNIISYAIALISSISFYYLVDFVIKIWIGKEYLLSNFLELAFSIQLFLMIFRISLWQFIEISCLFYISRISDLIGLIINFILSIVLYSKFKLLGVIIATIVSLVTQYIIEFYMILKRFNKININLILEQILLIIIYIISISLIKNNLLLFILVTILVLIYITLYLRSIYYVFKNKKNN